MSNTPERYTASPLRPEGPYSFRRHMNEIVGLATPVALSRIAGLMLFVIDTAMIGNADSVELAYFGLANAVHMVLMLVGIGMMVGTAVLSAQALGAGSPHETGVIWRVSALHALALGLMGLALSFAGEWFLLLIGQDRELALGAGNVLVMLALGLPATLIFVASTLFLEALRRPRVGLYLMIAGNLANLPLNWLLIEGNLGMPAMGASGATLATTIVRWAALVAMVAYIVLSLDDERYNIRGRLTDVWAIGRKLRALGYPLGLAQGLESAAFASLTVMAGYLGANAVASFQITMNIIAFIYMGAIGTATATAVRVGHAIGRNSQQDVPMAGWSGLTAILIYMAVMAVPTVTMPEHLAGLFTNDPAVLALSIPTLLVAAAIYIPDGAQGVLMGALRGTGDVWIPTAMHLCSFLLVMIPSAALFALHLGFGVPGLMIGTLIGVTCATILLAARFHVISKREIKRL
jgi:MATE family multidrug resistance protein